MLELITIKVNKLLNQAHKHKVFHKHCLQSDNNGIRDQKITMIEQAETEKSLRQKELYWYHRLKTCILFGLNEREVYAV